MTRRIEIDSEIYAHLEQQVQGFEQPNDVLRRLLLPEANMAAAAPAAGAGPVGRLHPLLDARLVTAGDELTHTQLRKGNTFSATVDEQGWVVTERGAFREPSPALRDLVGTQIDGWKHWVHVPSGKSLRQLRHDMLT